MRAVRRLGPGILLAAMLVAEPLSVPALSAGRPLPAVQSRAITTQRVLALTFDDGPSLYTPQVIAELKSFHAHATFFEVGEHVLRYPKFSRAVIRAGDEIGNHTYTHPDLLYLSDQTIRDELLQTQAVIHAATGVDPVWFRPPYGGIDSRVAEVAVSLHLHSISWSVDPRDWARPGTAAVIESVLAAARPGSVIIMHDGGGDRSQTVAALPVILRLLRKQGYRFVTLSQLFHLAQPNPCDTSRAARWFATAGIVPEESNPMYRAWLRYYCQGDNFGPATSHLYFLAANLEAQNFARTGRRFEWSKAARVVHVSLMWTWGTRIFSRHAVDPRWHTRITDAWFDEYFHGRNWGPALRRAKTFKGGGNQCFLRGCAANRSGSVIWQRPR